MQTPAANHAKSNEPRPTLFDAIAANQPWGRLRSSQLVSAVLHLGVFALLVVGQASAPKTQRPPGKIICKCVFAPEPRKKQEIKPVTTSPSPIPAPSVVPSAVVSKDSKRLKIAFTPDPSGEELKGVMEKLGGAVGFASPDEVLTCQQLNPPGSLIPPQCLFRYQVSAPGWDFTEGNYSLGGYFLVQIGQPDPPYLKALRSKYGIPQEYIAYGLLPESLRLDVDDSIDDEMKRISEPGSTIATSVEITFAAAQPRGFHLKITATKPIAPATN